MNTLDLSNKELLTEDYSDLFGSREKKDNKAAFKNRYGKQWRKYWQAYKKIDGDKKTLAMSWSEIDTLLGDTISKDATIKAIEDDPTISAIPSVSPAPTPTDLLESSDEEKTGMPMWAWFAIGGGVLLIATIVTVVLIRKKKVAVAQINPT